MMRLLIQVGRFNVEFIAVAFIAFIVGYSAGDDNTESKDNTITICIASSCDGRESE